jgi:hypothetical protein
MHPFAPQMVQIASDRRDMPHISKPMAGPCNELGALS